MLLVSILSIFINLSFATYLTPHRFDEYPEDLVYQLNDQLFLDDATIINCDNCTSINLPQYVITGFKDLINFKTQDIYNKDSFSGYGAQLPKSSLREQELAIVVDYHFSYSHLFSYKKEASGLLTIKIHKSYPISGGKGGLSNTKRSGATPAGIHFVYAKQHHNAKRGEIVWAKPSSLIGKVVTPTQGDQWWEPGIITTRRIRLAGLEKRNSNSKARAILFHGTHEEGFIGMQKSGGCLRMNNHDVIELFEQTHIGMLVNITGDTTDEVQDGSTIYAYNAPEKIYSSSDKCEAMNFFTTDQVNQILSQENKTFPDNNCNTNEE